MKRHLPVTDGYHDVLFALVKYVMGDPDVLAGNSISHTMAPLVLSYARNIGSP